MRKVRDIDVVSAILSGVADFLRNKKVRCTCKTSREPKPRTITHIELSSATFGPPYEIYGKISHEDGQLVVRWNHSVTSRFPLEDPESLDKLYADVQYHTKIKDLKVTATQGLIRRGQSH